MTSKLGFRLAAACLAGCISLATQGRCQDKKAAAVVPAARVVPAQPAQSSGGGFLSFLFGGGEAAQPKYDSASHEKLKAVKVSGKEVAGTLQTLCTDEKGNVYAVVGKGRYEGGKSWNAGGKNSQSEVQVFDAEGKHSFSWVVDFKASAVCVGPKGDVFVAGDGMIAKCKPDGKIIAQSEAPHLAKLMSDKGKLRTLAEQRKKQTVDSYSNMLKQFEKQMEARKKTKADGNGKAGQEDEQAAFGGSDQMVKMYKQILDQAQKKSIEDYMAEIGGQVKSVNSVAASESEVFLTCGEAKGYGYSIWRMNYDLTDAKQIKEGLSGCCGQMDVQCCKEGLVVAENTRHRVGIYDRNGKFKSTFGVRDREGEGAGFGGCCNPMNTRPCPNGEIITAESEGFIKRFDKNGKYLGLVAFSPLSGGCKNVAVAASPDGNRVFFCDQPGSQILILVKKSTKPLVTASAK